MINDKSTDTGLPFERLALREIVALRHTLGVLEADLVWHARRRGVTWTALAQDLRMTRQGARQKHLQNDPFPPQQRQVSGFDAWLEQMRASRATMRG